MIISSLNALIEALKENSPVDKVLISQEKKDKRDRKVKVILDLCRENKVPFQLVPQQLINRKAGADNQGVFARVAEVSFHTLEEILGDIKTGLIVILDCINDTGNMGAIMRSAVAANVDAIIVPQRNSAPLDETVLKTSAGCLLKARIHQAKNLVQTVKLLKERDFWIVGAAMGGSMPYYEYDFKYKTAIVVGNEHKGISALLMKNSDHLVSIPHSPQVESLNVSAAAAVILFEALRQKAV